MEIAPAEFLKELLFKCSPEISPPTGLDQVLAGLKYKIVRHFDH